MGHLPMYFFEVADHPPAARFLQARGGPGRGSRARDDSGGDKEWALAHKHEGRTELQHKVRFCGGRVAIPMTAPDIRDRLKSVLRREQFPQ